jgi:hypothetical protein
MCVASREARLDAVGRAYGIFFCDQLEPFYREVNRERPLRTRRKLCCRRMGFFFGFNKNILTAKVAKKGREER